MNLALIAKIAFALFFVAASAAAIYLTITYVDNVGDIRQNEDENRKVGFGPGFQDWDWVEVREGAHLFWWLYYTTNESVSYTDRPLAIWLQGGPGSSSSGYGNFEEFGPLDLEGNERNFTWVKDMNVLFIDSPVGTGFSYVANNNYSLLTTTNAQIADDLVNLLIGFYEKHPEFQATPLHIFSESYGGKVAMEFAYALHNAIQGGRIICDFKSVTSVDGWISPLDSMYSWAPFLLYMGFVDDYGYDRIMESTRQTEIAFENGDFVNSTLLWGITEDVIYDVTDSIDFYNVLRSQRYYGPSSTTKNRIFKKLPTEELMYRTLVERNNNRGYEIDDIDGRQRTDPLTELMRGPVSEALNISEHIVFGSQSNRVFTTLYGDFMKPDIEMVEHLLNETNIEVIIITGQLDLIVATPGTVEWVKKIRWSGADAYKASSRMGLGVNGILEGYYKKHETFSMYWINRAGHMVPFDNPPAMDYILRAVTKYHE